MKTIRYVKLNLIRKPLQNAILVLSLTLTIVFALVLTKFLLISNERFQTIAREGQAIIAAKSGDIDTLLSTLNLESDTINLIPYNLYQTLQTQTAKSFEDGQKTYTQVNQVIPFLHFALIHNKYQLIGTSRDFLERFNPNDSLKITEGRWVEADDEIVVGLKVFHDLKLHLGEAIAINIGSINKTFKMVGVVDGKGLAWDNGAYTTISSAQKNLEEAGLLKDSIWKSNVLTSILVYINSENYSSLKNLINNRTVSQLISIPETIAKLENLTMSGTQLTSFFVILISVLGLCAIFGITMTRADALLNHFAILNSLGHTRKDILKITLYENLLIWLSSSFLAILFYAAIFTWVQQNITLYSSHNISLWSIEFIYIIGALGFGIALFSFIPVMVLSKKGIHTILRRQ